jgi:hypothetical protein
MREHAVHSLCPSRSRLRLPSSMEDGDNDPQLHWQAHAVHSFLLGCGLLSVMGCGVEVDAASQDDRDAVNVQAADLRLLRHRHQRRNVDLESVQQVDAADIADGDYEGFERADLSDALLHGRRATQSSSEERARACALDPRVELGLVSLETCVGGELFFRADFGGNGRTCGSCHPAANNFTVDASFIATLLDSDPLFVAEFDPALEQLEKPELLRKFGLFVVNPDGNDDPTNRFTMRSASHTLSLQTSITPAQVPGDGTILDGTTLPPLHRLGWSGDGAPGDGEMRDFALGAIEQHAPRSLGRVAGVDFEVPPDEDLDRMAKFQLGLGRTNELELSAIRVSDSRADRGRINLMTGTARDCNNCHSNGGANIIVTNLETGEAGTTNFNFNIGTERARLGLLDEAGVPFDGGFGREPFDSDGDGETDSFGNGDFNGQPLIEAADTGPYFHTHAFETLEDAIGFYRSEAFGDSPVGQTPLPGDPAGPLRLSDDDVLDLGRFLRVLNAAFNCQLAMQRLAGAMRIGETFGNRFISIQRGLLAYANVELLDAIEVLSAVPYLGIPAQIELHRARKLLHWTSSAVDRGQRMAQTAAALALVSDANATLGAGIHFELGEANLMF